MTKKLSIIFAVSILMVIFASAAKSQTGAPNSSVVAAATDTEDIVYKPSEVDKRVQSIKKPKPKASSCDASLGVTKFQAVFRKTGQVTDIRMVVESDCRSFNKNALKAVRKIKFKPAMKGGQPVSVLMFVEYVYQVD